MSVIYPIEIVTLVCFQPNAGMTNSVQTVFVIVAQAGRATVVMARYDVRAAERRACRSETGGPSRTRALG